MNIGIDIGGTKIAGAVVDDSGHIVGDIKRALTPSSTAGVLSCVADMVGALRAAGAVEAVGVGMPGCIDALGNVLWGGGKLKFLSGMAAKQELEEALGLPVVVENDANCFALAEAVYGAGKDISVVLGVIWGTGIGGGLVLDGVLYRGAFGAALELGHMVANREEKETLEQCSSGPSIVSRYRALGGTLDTLLPTEIYAEGSGAGKAALAEAVEDLGWGLAAATSILNPGVIVLGGGVSLLPDKVYENLNRIFRENLPSSLVGDIKIVRHAISHEAGIIGASLVART